MAYGRLRPYSSTGTRNRLEYTCADGTVGECAPWEECLATQPFPHDKIHLACQSPLGIALTPTRVSIGATASVVTVCALSSEYSSHQEEHSWSCAHQEVVPSLHVYSLFSAPAQYILRCIIQLKRAFVATAIDHRCTTLHFLTLPMGMHSWSGAHQVFRSGVVHEQGVETQARSIASVDNQECYSLEMAGLCSIPCFPSRSGSVGASILIVICCALSRRSARAPHATG
eukprot:g20614.t1